MTRPEIEFRPVAGSSDELAPLIAEAEGQGYRFMRRLRDEWASGANRFDGSGECLLGAYREDHLVGVGGLNRDPYATEAAGRLRHLYILGAARRTGVGAALVTRLMTIAGCQFDLVRLRTDSPDAGRFYKRLGFGEIMAPDASHQCVTSRDNTLPRSQRVDPEGPKIRET